MNYNDFSKQAHDNAVKHGFWDSKLSNEHFLMLVITEISEAVEADRKDRHQNVQGFKDATKFNIRSFIGQKDRFNEAFLANIKDTVEDEMADVAIRLADLAGHLGLDFEKMNPCRYFRAYDKFSFTENAFALCKGLNRSTIGVEKRIQFGLDYIFNWAAALGFDLEWNVEQKMTFNAGRPIRHGKQY